MNVNGEAVLGSSYSAVVQMIKATPSVLRLVVVAQEDDILQMVRSN